MNVAASDLGFTGAIGLGYVAPPGKNRLQFTVEERFWRDIFPEPMSGCWLWTGRGFPYGNMFIGKGQYLAHRLSYAIHKGPIPAGATVRHKCDNPSCVNPDHLVIGSQADNVRDAWERGRASPPPHYRGDTHPMARLSDADVIEIRRLSLLGVSYTQLSKKFNIGKSTIAYAVTARRLK